MEKNVIHVKMKMLECLAGCKGACSFSLERNINLKYEEGCETGYAEISEGVCEPCNEINHGCYECHYEDKYPEIIQN